MFMNVNLKRWVLLEEAKPGGHLLAWVRVFAAYTAVRAMPQPS